MNEQSNKVLQQLCAQLQVLINEAVTASVRDTLEIPSINHNTKVKYYRVLVQGLFTKFFKISPSRPRCRVFSMRTTSPSSGHRLIEVGKRGLYRVHRSTHFFKHIVT